MARRKIEIRLNSHSIEKAIRGINAYKNGLNPN